MSTWNGAEAEYIAALKKAARQAPAIWAHYAQARSAMDTAFTALITADTQQWMAALSRLVTAHDSATKAAAAWDRMAETIAVVHDKHVAADLSRHQAYEAAGIDATDWVIGLRDDYGVHSLASTPLLRQLRQAITPQRDHAAQVSFLAFGPSGR